MITYLSGWLVKKCSLCADCTMCLIKKSNDGSCSSNLYNKTFLDNKRYDWVENGGLIDPNEELCNVIYQIEQFFLKTFPSSMSKCGIAQYLYSGIFPLLDFKFI